MRDLAILGIVAIGAVALARWFVVSQGGAAAITAAVLPSHSPLEFVTDPIDDPFRTWSTGESVVQAPANPIGVLLSPGTGEIL